MRAKNLSRASLDTKMAHVKEIYAYITAVSVKQGKLLPLADIQGDGTRFDRKLFAETYEVIQSVLPKQFQ